MMMEHQRGGTYISNQVRMHACHLTLKHCTHIFIRYRKILNEVQQDYGKRKKDCVDDNQESVLIME